MIISRLVTILLLAVIAFGCAKPPQAIDGHSLQKLTSLDRTHVFAGSSDGAVVAYADDGLYLLDVETDKSSRLSKFSPQVLAWDHGNKILAAAFKDDKFESRIVRYSTHGSILFEQSLPIAVSKLGWSLRGDLLVTGYRLEVFSFGSNLQQHLYSFMGPDQAKVVLADSTLKPHTSKFLAEGLSNYQPVFFAGDGDELFYVHMHDPPEFAPYLRIISMNWQTGNRKALLQVPVQELKFAPGKHEDAVVAVSGNSQVEMESWPEPVQDKGTESDGVIFKNGQLFIDETMLRDWGRGSRFQHLNNGQFLLGTSRALYKGDGLPGFSQKLYSEERWTLRRWRSAGLVTHDEYLEKMKEVQQ